MSSDYLVDQLLEFVSCAVHSLLYVRSVYPSALFEQRMYLGAAVWQSRHPEINSYIRRVLDNVKPLLLAVRIYMNDMSLDFIL